MIIVILVVSVALFMLYVYLEEISYNDYSIGLCLSGFLVFASFIALILLTISISSARTIEPKIAMYTEENANIEAQMDALVSKYMEYEQDTFEGLKGESSITLVSLYPELKSDVLVQQQLEVYVANNNKIKELKEELIDVSVWKWWLYFGR